MFIVTFSQPKEKEIFFMDKFLEITFENQILATKDGDKFVEYFAPFMEKLKGAGLCQSESQV